MTGGCKRTLTAGQCKDARMCDCSIPLTSLCSPRGHQQWPRKNRSKSIPRLPMCHPPACSSLQEPVQVGIFMLLRPPMVSYLATLFFNSKPLASTTACGKEDISCHTAESWSLRQQEIQFLSPNPFGIWIEVHLRNTCPSLTGAAARLWSTRRV